MLQLMLDNEFLDIDGVDMEIEKVSPLFSFDVDPIEYSTPITIKWSEKNCRKLQYVFVETAPKKKIKINVGIYDDGAFIENGILLLDKSSTNRFFIQKSSVTGVIYTGLSEFLQTVKDKKMKDLSLGGVRNLGSFTTEDPFDSSNGWWQKMHDTWNFEDDYLFAPVQNYEQGISEIYQEVGANAPQLNPLDRSYFFIVDGGPADFWHTCNQIQLQLYDIIEPLISGEYINGRFSVFTPLVKVKYLLEQIIKEHGWDIEFNIDSDDDTWQKLVLLGSGHFKVSSADYYYENRVPAASLSISLKDYMPDVTVKDFLKAICTRYGWAPLFNANTKKCRLVSLRNFKSFAKKDWTKYAAHDAINSIEDEKTFSIKNSFLGKQVTPNQPEIRATVMVARYQNDLPALISAFEFYDNITFYVFAENAYYNVDLDDSNNRIWVKSGSNIFDDGVTQEVTNTISTDCNTIDVSDEFFITALGEDATYKSYRGFIPSIIKGINDDAGITTLLYHGMVGRLINSLNPADIGPVYPYVSSLAVIQDEGYVEQVATWSNVFKHVETYTNEDIGIVAYWYKPWFEAMREASEVDRIIYLPFHEISQINFDDLILIENIPYLIKSYIIPRPYKGFIQTTLVKLNI